MTDGVNDEYEVAGVKSLLLSTLIYNIQQSSNKHTTDMIHHLEIPDTTAIVYTVIAILTLVATYITRYSRARRKSVEAENALIKAQKEYIQTLEQEGAIQEELMKAINETHIMYKEMRELDSKIIDMWKGKYTALQQEIECHIHEVHEEVERPHVEKTWPKDKNAHTHNGWQEYVNEPEETSAEKEKKAYWDAENDFWESLRRLHKEDHN